MNMSSAEDNVRLVEQQTMQQLKLEAALEATKDKPLRVANVDIRCQHLCPIVKNCGGRDVLIQHATRGCLINICAIWFGFCATFLVVIFVNYKQFCQSVVLVCANTSNFYRVSSSDTVLSIPLYTSMTSTILMNMLALSPMCCSALRRTQRLGQYTSGIWLCQRPQLHI